MGSSWAQAPPSHRVKKPPKTVLLLAVDLLCFFFHSCWDKWPSKVTRGHFQMCQMFIWAVKTYMDHIHSWTETPTLTQALPDNLGAREPKRFLHGPEHERRGGGVRCTIGAAHIKEGIKRVRSVVVLTLYSCNYLNCPAMCTYKERLKKPCDRNSSFQLVTNEAAV